MSNAELTLPGHHLDEESVGLEYLTFVLGEESYGIDILKVQEIRAYEKLTTIANTPDFIKGVVNLRGQIVPIVDLRIKFRLQKVEYNDLTVVIVLNLGARIVGMVVDRVTDVMNLQVDQIRKMPETVSTVDTKFITGLATVDDNMFILIDIEELMSNQELQLVENITNKQAA